MSDLELHTTPPSPLNRRDVLRFATGVAAGGALAITGLRSGLSSVAAQDATPAAATDLSVYPEVVYTGAEYSFEGPAEFAAGLTRITFQNNGQMDHHAMFLMLNEGKSIADLPAAMEQGLPGLFTLGAAIGGPGSISPGQTATVIQDVAAGNYLLMCLIPDADGIPHAAKGMLMPITVTEGGAAATPPTAAGSIQLEDFHFTGLPASIPAGQQVWEVSNVGQQLHEIVIYRQAPGVSFDQVMGMLSAEAAPATPGAEMEGMEGMDGTPMAEASPSSAGIPFEAVAGWAPANPGMSAWIVVDADPGDYFAICFIPDAASGAPHFALGMIQQFTVS